MEISKLLITPAMAKAMLENGIRNRRLNKEAIARYVSDMVAGRWKQDTGELIKISKDGKPIDGYHRLTAVVLSGSSIWFHVASGLDESVFDVLDTGKSRSANDIFNINDIPNSNIVPSIISVYYYLSNGAGSSSGIAASKRLTNAQILIIYNEDAERWQDITRHALKFYSSFAKILVPSTIGGMYRLFSEINANSAIEFMDQLCTGRNIDTDVLFLLRDTLMRDSVSQRKMSIVTKNAIIIKAWNSWRRKKPLKVLKFDAIKEQFPKPI